MEMLRKNTKTKCACYLEILKNVENFRDFRILEWKISIIETGKNPIMVSLYCHGYPIPWVPLDEPFFLCFTFKITFFEPWTWKCEKFNHRDTERININLTLIKEHDFHLMKNLCWWTHFYFIINFDSLLLNFWDIGNLSRRGQFDNEGKIFFELEKVLKGIN